ncbi:MAG: hypothetical protein ACOY3P_20065 [Planctomycetota bacterium]
MNDLKKFALENLGDLDLGKAKVGFERLVRQAALDCIDRPGDKRARRVTLTVTLKPVSTVNGNTIDCESIDASLKAKAAIPDFETRTYDFAIRNNGDMLFNPESPTNHKQQSFLGEEVAE